MSRTVLLALTVALAGLAGCGQKEAEPAKGAAPAPAPAPAPAVAPAPEPQAVGESCSQDCGGGKVAAIQCAEGETPVCDCAATPASSCRVPPAGAP